MDRLSVGMCVAAVVLCASVASSAQAQIIYKPVQYQYEAFGKKIYYGGNDARVLDLAARRAFMEKYLRYGRHPFGQPGYGERSRFSPQSSVYTDLLPPYIDAANYGMTADDARNEAMARLPRYFRKSDLLKSATVDCDGAIIVPAIPAPVCEPRGTIEIRPYSPTTAPATRNAKIWIIPKSKVTSDKLTVAQR